MSNKLNQTNKTNDESHTKIEVSKPKIPLTTKSIPYRIISAGYEGIEFYNKLELQKEQDKIKLKLNINSSVFIPRNKKETTEEQLEEGNNSKTSYADRVIDPTASALSNVVLSTPNSRIMDNDYNTNQFININYNYNPYVNTSNTGNNNNVYNNQQASTINQYINPKIALNYMNSNMSSNIRTFPSMNNFNQNFYNLPQMSPNPYTFSSYQNPTNHTATSIQVNSNSNNNLSNEINTSSFNFKESTLRNVIDIKPFFPKYKLNNSNTSLVSEPLKSEIVCILDEPKESIESNKTKQEEIKAEVEEATIKEEKGLNVLSSNINFDVSDKGALTISAVIKCKINIY